MLRLFRKPLRRDRHDTVIAVPRGARCLGASWDGYAAHVLFLADPTHPPEGRKFFMASLEAQLPDDALAWDAIDLIGAGTISAIIFEVPGQHMIPDEVRVAESIARNAPIVSGPGDRLAYP